MKSSITTICVGTMLCAVLSACNDGDSVAKSQVDTGTKSGSTAQPPAQGGGTGTAVTPPSPPARIETFAQSLETFNLAFNKSTRKISVSFARLAPEVADSAGMPTIETTQEFLGEIPRGAAGAALAPRAAGQSDYAVRVDCADDSCLTSTTTIDRLSGTLTGRAVLKREAREMNAQGNHNLPSGRLTTSHDALTAALAELNNHDNLNAVITASQTQVEDGRHDWFEIRYDFLPQPFMRADQPGYFDDKSVNISGDIGAHELVKITRSVTFHDQTTAASGSAYAKVKFRESPFAIAAAFERTDLRNPSVTVSQSMGDSLSW